VKLTSVKPSGSVSLLAGATPGLHWPEARYYLRRVRLSKQGDAALIKALIKAGYDVEAAVDDERCDVVSVPVSIGQSQPHDNSMVVVVDDSKKQAARKRMSNNNSISVRTLDEVTMFEQLLMASFMQRHWADNQVSKERERTV
jgi:ribonucleoside-triphosphate reductase (thioredoxin)